eukprot:Phypoly_transcript_01083.p1 GENE.Phypoly_transcript_01083~~Phypoly_transcript_01083.p1  ORF type:complete len:303 (+),score=60.34 Phypoly_transcript_01083:1453-2361(+)
MFVMGGATDSDVLDVHEFFFDVKQWGPIELSTQGVPRQGHSTVLRGESIFLFGGVAGINHNQLDMLSLGNEGEDEELVQDEEIARTQSLPRPLWEAILLKKHPEILAYRELARGLTGVRTYARTRKHATTEDPAHLNHQLVLDLIVEYLHSQGCSRAANAIVDESKIPYFPLSSQPTADSRLVTILKVLKSGAKPKNIFDAEFSVVSRPQDSVDPELELVDHMAGAGRVDAQAEEEDVDIWLEPDDSRKNIVRTKDPNGKSVIRAANLNKLVQVLDKGKAPYTIDLNTFHFLFLPTKVSVHH